MVQFALDLYRFLRFSAFGATAALPILGAASADQGLTGRRTLGLVGVAAAFHAFAYVHNDVCDLELDRTQPLRAAYPLVRGAVAPRTALALALACVPATFALDWRLRRCSGTQADALPTPTAPPARHTKGWAGRLAGRRASCKGALNPCLQGQVCLGAAFGLMAAYNRWGKGCPAPPLMDLAQGLGWAALLAYGALATGRRPTRLTGLLVGYEVLLILMVNGVHGALRDLGNDKDRGARTTAILFGATVGPEGGLAVPPALAAYALALQAALLALPLWGALANLAGYEPRARATAVAGLGTLDILTVVLLGAAARGGARPADVGMLHLILLLSTPLALVGPGLAPAPWAVLMLAHTLPLLANGMTYDALGWAWGMASTG